MASFCRYGFFLVFLLIGLAIFKDYGVHLDEYVNQALGNENLEYINRVTHHGSIARTIPLGLNSNALTHGPCIELPLAFLKKFLHLTDVRDILLMRHLCCFLLFFMGVYFFYLLGALYFNDWKMGLLGSLFLVLSPRIFANAFYDTYDIPFLSFYILNMYTLLRWLRRRSFLNASLHALSCALLTDIRPIGLIMPFFTVVVFFLDILKGQTLHAKINVAVQFSFYIILFAVLMVLGWPLLWPHPLINFITVLNGNFDFRFPFPATSLFLGREVSEATLPWYYAPVWILITTPMLYILYFIIGFFIALKSILNGSLFAERRNNIFFICCFLFPLCLANGKIYNTWRHLFFIYPAFLMIALIGLSAIWQTIKNRLTGLGRLLAYGAVILMTMLSTCSISYFMVRNHPFQYVYFNRLAGKDMQEIKKRFVLDYWGLPYRQGLEAILKKDSDEHITVSTGINFGQFIGNNINILPAKARARFQQTDIGDAKYLITNYQWHAKNYQYVLFDSFKVGNASILGVYKLE